MFQLTRFSHNTVFSRNQNARYAGTRCIYYVHCTTKKLCQADFLLQKKNHDWNMNTQTNEKGSLSLIWLFEKIISVFWMWWIWQYGLWSFQTGSTKLERFLPKNQHTQRKWFNFENWISGGLRSFQKSEF